MVGRALILVCCVAGAALAQSKRYPPEPVDKDHEKEQRSGLWENASKPRTQPYEKLLAEARALIAERTEDAYKQAAAKLTDAIALLPDEKAAYALRADSSMALRQWAACADDFAAADARTLTEETDRRIAQEQRRKLGLCLARAGRLSDAERVLADAALTGSSTGEMLMRLGEVRIALGKLDEAINALQSALEMGEGGTGVLARWLLAAAYDRARRTSEAVETARVAVYQDREATQLRNPAMPLLGAGELEYLLGLAAEYGHADAEPGQPERALVYFKRFVRLAPESPWRRRAEEHIRDLKTTNFPEAMIYRSGNAAFDLIAARNLVRKQMPALRSCLAKTPGVVFSIVVTRVGPTPTPTPAPSPPPRPVVRGGYRAYGGRPIALPPDGVQLEVWNDSEPAPKPDKEAAQRCIEPIVAKIGFAKIKEQNAYVQFWFSLTNP